MVKRARMYSALAVAGAVGLVVACSADQQALSPMSAGAASSMSRGGEHGASGAFQFAALGSSTACTVGGDALKPLTVPQGYDQTVLASEPSYADSPDMNTQNENGPDAGRYLYRVHEVGSNGSLSVTDLETGVTKIIAHRADWESLDPTVWTAWGTLLFGEEAGPSSFRDPNVPQAVDGLVYEVFFKRGDPASVDSVVARPAIGSKAHEGMRFDTKGNLYSISERTPGYIFKFTPDRKGDLSSGQTYVLKIVSSEGDRVGDAEWVPLDREAVQVDASAAADAVQATGYGRPEDVETARFAKNEKDGADRLYVAITSEHRVLAIDLEKSDDGKGPTKHATAHVSDYVRVGVNATPEFTMPDNLALDRAGNLYITEDPGGSFSSGKRQGDDIWVAAPGQRGASRVASSVSRFASLTDCEAEPTGIYYDMLRERLFVNVQHRGGDRLDKTIGIFRAGEGR